MNSFTLLTLRFGFHNRCDSYHTSLAACTGPDSALFSPVPPDVDEHL